ncbi:hypothetical protein BVX95_01525 [archaeon D22]|nr:hypothetical protein BVX95_01525 [archaeon D22]
MKKIILMSLLLSVLLFTGCNASVSKNSVKECFREDAADLMGIGHLCTTKQDCISYVSNENPDVDGASLRCEAT